MSRKALAESVSLGGLAFLAGVLTTIVTAIAIILKKKADWESSSDHYDGWEDSLGI